MPRTVQSLSLVSLGKVVFPCSTAATIAAGAAKMHSLKQQEQSTILPMEGGDVLHGRWRGRSWNHEK
jgi:hypothetical protein